MTRRVVGVDITAKSIRAVQMLHRSGQRPIVEKFIEYPLTLASTDDAATRAEFIAGKLKLAWAHAGFKTRDVVIGVGGADVFVREFIAPDLPKSKLKKELPELVKGELPMPVEDVVLDYYANRRFEQDGESKLGGLVVAANRQVVDDLMESARKAKLNVLSIDLIPFALSRTFAKRSNQTGVKAYVRAANSYINIMVTDGPAVTFVRLVPWEQNNGKGIPLSTDEDSESAGIFLEFTDSNTAELAVIQDTNQAMAALHKQAVRELDDTIRYFHLNHPDKIIEEVLVSGYRLDNPAFIEAMSLVHDIKVTGITRTGLGHKRSTVTKVEDSELPDHLAVALSLAEGVAL